MRPRIFQIANGLGCGNIGDELMSRTFWSLLPPGFTLDVALFPESRFQHEPYPPQHRYHAACLTPAEMDRIAPQSGILLGPTLIAEAEGVGFPLEFITERLRYFIERGLPVDALGIGAEHLHSSRARSVFDCAFKHLRSWTVREEESRQALLELGVDGERIVVGADWAWRYTPPPLRAGWSRIFWENLGVDAGRPLIVVNLFNFPYSQPLAWEPMARALDRLALDHGYTVAFFANDFRHPHFDSEAASAVRRLMCAPAVIVPNEYYSPGEAIALLRHATVTIGQRYHFCIQTVLAGTVPVAIGRGEKLGRLCRDLEIEPCGDIHNLDAAALVDQVLDAVALREQMLPRLAMRRAELRRSASRNFDYFKTYHRVEISSPP